MSKSKTKPKRKYTQAPRVTDKGVECPHCRNRYDHKIKNTYPNGNRRRICGTCGKPFVTMRVNEVGDE